MRFNCSKNHFSGSVSWLACHVVNLLKSLSFFRLPVSSFSFLPSGLLAVKAGAALALISVTVGLSFVFVKFVKGFSGFASCACLHRLVRLPRFGEDVKGVVIC